MNCAGAVVFLTLTALLGAYCTNTGTNTGGPSAPLSEVIKPAVELASGFYIDKRKNPALDKTVILTGANFGYLNHFYNFKCFMDRLSLKVLVVSMDRRLHNHIQEKLGNNASASDKPLSQFFSVFWEGKKVIKEQATTFRSEQFNMITHRKTEATIAVMELGYDVVFIDIDIALVRDPIPYLLWQNVDYVHSHNRICPQYLQWDFWGIKHEEEGNTGFFFARSNEKTLKLWRDTLALAPSYHDLDDQSVFWLRIRNRTQSPTVLPLDHCGHFNNNTRTGKELVTCALDGCIFSAGALRGVAYDWLRDNLRDKKEKVVTVHANYLKGNDLKKMALQKHGYWIVRENKDGSYTNGNCAPFTPNL